MTKNIVPAILFIFMLLLAPATLAQQGPIPAAETATVEDLTPPPAASMPAASPGPKDAPLLPLNFPSQGLGMLLWVLGGVILVMALLYLALKALSRPRRFKGLKGRKSVFELRGIQSLDNTKYLAAVKIEGRLLVVGVTADRVIPVANWFVDDEDGQPGLNFSPGYPGPDLGPSLNIKSPEDDNSPPDISIADLSRDHEK